MTDQMPQTFTLDQVGALLTALSEKVGPDVADQVLQAAGWTPDQFSIFIHPRILP